jgi:hypothetical protein
MTTAGVASTRVKVKLAASPVYPVLYHTLGTLGRESRVGTR